MASTIPKSLYKSLFDATLDGLAYCQMVFDAQGRPVDFIFVKINENFEALTGLKNAEGKKVSRVIPGIAASNPELFEIYGRVSSTGKSEKFETYVVPLSRWFSVLAYSFEKNFFVAVFQNITSEKRAEEDLKDAKMTAQIEEAKYKVVAKNLEKFKLALDSVSDNAIITDSEGIVIYANRAIKTVTGYDPEEAVGKKSGVLWKKPMPREYYQAMWDTIKRRKERFIGEIENRRKNGEIYTASISIYPILGKQGEAEFFLSIERDITKDKEIEHSKNEFISLASHQLRTPPTIIGWYAETLLSGDLGPLNEKQAEYLKEVYTANKRMVYIINSLLNISRIEMGTFAISAKEINLGNIIDETAKELASRFNRNIELKKDYGGLIPLRADPNIMQIIIDNLLSNAFKYSPPENAKIGIAAKIENNSLLLDVTDNGIGMAAKDQNRVFEKLFRADNAISTNPDGTGLGLYMTKRIVVEGLGGKIWFDSEENKGSAFHVSIPIASMKDKHGTTELVQGTTISPH